MGPLYTRHKRKFYGKVFQRCLPQNIKWDEISTTLNYLPMYFPPSYSLNNTIGNLSSSRLLPVLLLTGGEIPPLQIKNKISNLNL